MRSRLVRRVLAAGAVIPLLLAAMLAWRWARPAYTPEIIGARAVADLELVKIGSFDQWLLIRGHDSRNPIVLFLHGGPGMPAMFLAHAFQRELERHFTVVHWDRLGAGKSYRADIPPDAMSVERELNDLHALTSYLIARFGRRPILLVGHSYGSYLGVRALQRYPSLFAAYVGLGQVVDPERAEAIQRRFIRRAAARAGNNDLVAAIDRGSRIDVERWLFQYGAEVRAWRNWWPLVWLGFRAPEYSLSDVLNVNRGVAFTHKHMTYDRPSRALTDVTSLPVPVYLFLGRHDYTTPSELAVAFLERIRAPDRQIVWFEEAAHFPFLEQPDRFVAELRKVAQRHVVGAAPEFSLQPPS